MVLSGTMKVLTWRLNDIKIAKALKTGVNFWVSNYERRSCVCNVATHRRESCISVGCCFRLRLGQWRISSCLKTQHSTLNTQPSTVNTQTHSLASGEQIPNLRLTGVRCCLNLVLRAGSNLENCPQ